MDADQHRQAVTLAVAAAQVLAGQPIPELVLAIDRAHGVGPILDPTLDRAKHRAMDEDREVLVAALPLYRLGKKLEAMAAKRASAEEPRLREAALDERPEVRP